MGKKTKRLIILTISTIVVMVGVSLIFATAITKESSMLIIGIALSFIGIFGLNYSVK